MKGFALAGFGLFMACNSAFAQDRASGVHIEKEQAFPVSPARDKGVPDGAEVQSPVALRGTCFVMRQVLFLSIKPPW